MARTGATAVSAVLLALTLTGVGASPFVGYDASASAIAYDPIDVPPCDAGAECPPETTVTVTTTLPTPSSEAEAPETTITKTVTANPTPTKTPTPTPTKTTKAPEPTPVTQTSAPPPATLPTQTVDVPSVSSTPEDTDVVLPPVTGTTEAPTSPPPTEGQSAETDEIPLEMRNAAPEFDQRSLTQQLSIPALVLVLLVLFAVLIFEGRLRRMAHAAAVRKAGPMAGIMAGHPGHPDPHGYPAGPGYATAAMPAPGYPGGTAYAPIISFVPVQTYPGGQVQYGAVYQDPNAYTQPGYVPDEPAPAQPEPVVLQPDQFDSFSHQPAPSPEPEGEMFRPFSPGGETHPSPQGETSPEAEVYRSPFEPVIPPEAPPADIPPGGAKPYEDSPERPLPSASAAEPGDSEPWGGVLPLPGLAPESAPGHGLGSESAPGHGLGFESTPGHGPRPESTPGRGPGPESVPESAPGQGMAPESADIPSPAETTVVQPLPPAGKPKRGFGRRRK